MSVRRKPYRSWPLIRHVRMAQGFAPHIVHHVRKVEVMLRRAALVVLVPLLLHVGIVSMQESYPIMKPIIKTSIVALVTIAAASCMRVRTVSAAELRTGEHVHVSRDVVIAEDLYAAIRDSRLVLLRTPATRAASKPLSSSTKWCGTFSTNRASRDHPTIWEYLREPALGHSAGAKSHHLGQPILVRAVNHSQPGQLRERVNYSDLFSVLTWSAGKARRAIAPRSGPGRMDTVQP